MKTANQTQRRQHILDLLDTSVTESPNGDLRLAIVTDSFSLKLEIKIHKKRINPQFRGYVVNADLQLVGTGPTSVISWLRMVFSYHEECEKWDNGIGLSIPLELHKRRTARYALTQWLVQ